VKRRMLALTMTLLATACVHTYEVPDPVQPLRLPSESSFYVARAEDGQDARPATYELSGQRTTDAVVAALASRGCHASSGARVESFDQNLATARDAGSDYLVVPEILNWEDRVTEWSGLPDRIVIRMIVSDVASGEVVDDRTIHGKSRWGTLGGDHPQDLLATPLEQWAAQLF